MAEPQPITHLLEAAREGDSRAMHRLFEAVYAELKRRAHYQLAGSSPTLGTTELVHESFVKLTGGAPPDFQDRTHFFRVASRAMRQILIDRARAHLAQKRGGGAVRLDLDEVNVGTAPDHAAETLLALDDALSRLAVQNPRLAQVVELRFFGGLSVPETADTLEVSERTVKRDWRLARAFLHERLTDEENGID